MRGSQARAGEAHQCAAAFHPLDHGGARSCRHGADVCHHDHGRSLLDDLGDGLGQIGTGGSDDVGVGLECAVDVVQRGEQRLCCVALCLRDECHAAPSLAFVEHAGRRSMQFTVNRERGKVVAQFERDADFAACLGFSDTEFEDRVCKPSAAVVIGAGHDLAGNQVAFRPDRRDGEDIGEIVATGQRDHGGLLGFCPDQPADTCIGERPPDGLVVLGGKPIGQQR